MKQREERIACDGKLRFKEALQRLAQFYEKTARPERAAEWRQKLAEFGRAAK